MATKMIKKQVYLDKESARALHELSLQFDASETEVVRRALIYMFEGRTKAVLASEDPWKEFIGAYKGGPPDLASNVDDIYGKDF